MVRPNKPLPVAGASQPGVVEPVAPVSVAASAAVVEEPAPPVPPVVDVEPAPPVPHVVVEEPAPMPPVFVVVQKTDDEDGPPPDVPDFDTAPPPVPEFQVDVPGDSDSMLDAVFSEIAAAPPAKKQFAPVAVASPREEPDSFLDSVFNEIKPAKAKPAAPTDDITDSFLDSVFDGISAENKSKPTPAHQPASNSAAEEDGDDLLGAVFSQITSGSTSGSQRHESELLMDVVESGGIGKQLHQSGSASAAVSLDDSSSSIETASAVPAGPMLRNNPLMSPALSRPRVKSFAPSVLAPLKESSTIRAKGRSSQVIAGADTSADKAKVYPLPPSFFFSLVLICCLNKGAKCGGSFEKELRTAAHWRRSL